MFTKVNIFRSGCWERDRSGQVVGKKSPVQGRLLQLAPITPKYRIITNVQGQGKAVKLKAAGRGRILFILSDTREGLIFT
jgi:hypothetical protein